MKKFALFALAAAVALPVISGGALAETTPDPKMVKRGKKVAVKYCVACHDITEDAVNKVGPALWGIYGKPAGQIEGYEYSQIHLDKAKADSLVWDEATLDLYLKSPMEFIPGNKMVFPGLEREKDRKNLIEFLKTLK